MSQYAQDRLITLILAALIGITYLIPQQPTVHREQIVTAVPPSPLLAAHHAPDSLSPGETAVSTTLPTLSPGETAVSATLPTLPTGETAVSATLPTLPTGETAVSATGFPLSQAADHIPTSVADALHMAMANSRANAAANGETAVSTTLSTLPTGETAVSTTLSTLNPGETAVSSSLATRHAPPAAHHAPRATMPTIIHRFDGMTTQPQTALHSAPGPDHPQTAVLSEPTAIAVVNRVDASDWLLVVTGEGLHGWLPRTAVTLRPNLELTTIPVYQPGQAARDLLASYDAITRHQAQVRSEASLESAITSLNIPAHTPLTLIARDNYGLWVAVADEQGLAGWILASSLHVAPHVRLRDLPVTDFALPADDDHLPTAVSTAFGWGAQTHNIRANGSMVREMGATWIKVQYKFHEHSQARDVIDLIEQAHQRGLKVLLAIPGQEYPTHIDYDGYIAFLRDVAALQPAPDAIEIWNEMNIDFEWPAGEIDPATYVNRMLAPAYAAIKGENPDIMVISGAPAPTGFDDGVHAWADDRYIIGMAEAGAARYADCIGVHYNAGATPPTAVTGHPAGDHYGWYFMPSLHVYYEVFGRQLPLCITEMGYLTVDGLNKPLPDRFWWAAGTTLADQGEWMGEAITMARAAGFVQMLIIFSLDIHHYDQHDPQAGYAIVRYRTNDCPACGYIAGR